jgi:hypothetical protein
MLETTLKINGSKDGLIIDNTPELQNAKIAHAKITK